MEIKTAWHSGVCSKRSFFFTFLLSFPAWSAALRTVLIKPSAITTGPCFRQHCRCRGVLLHAEYLSQGLRYLSSQPWRLFILVRFSLPYDITTMLCSTYRGSRGFSCFRAQGRPKKKGPSRTNTMIHTYQRNTSIDRTSPLCERTSLFSKRNTPRQTTSRPGQSKAKQSKASQSIA